jgi:hypothetical protein
MVRRFGHQSAPPNAGVSLVLALIVSERTVRTDSRAPGASMQPRGNSSSTTRTVGSGRRFRWDGMQQPPGQAQRRAVP